MSNQQCPECGRQLKPNAKFCSYCGVPLTARQKAVGNVQAQPATTAPKTGNEIKEEVTKIPPTVESALVMRGKLERLRSQKAALDEEKETVKVKQLVGELSEKEAKAQSDKFQQRLDPIKKEIDELEKKAITPLEQLQQDKEVQEGRLQRLEELQKSGEVEDAIYQRLSSEYQGKLTEINQQLDNEVSQANRWLAQLEDRKQQLEFDKETLQIRARIDEVSKRDVKKQLKGIDDEVNKLTSIIGGLRSVLGSAAAPPKAFAPKPTAPASPTPSDKAASGNCPYCQTKITPGSKWCYSCGRLLQG
jgi:DNA repair exonuclease SbcCD ATPase subunit